MQRSWRGNAEDRSGIATLKAGSVEVEIPFSDVAHFHALMKLLDAALNEIQVSTRADLRARILREL